MPCTSAPASTSSAASRSDFGVVFEYWNRPVSVTSATYSASAISAVSSTPSSRSTSRTISPVEDASATTRFTSPKRELSWWWSTSTTTGARTSGSSLSPIRRAFAQSTASSTRSSASSGSDRRRSVSSRNRYSAGSGASPARYITTSFPSVRRASDVASSDPSASPSGFSCVTTVNRSWSRIAPTTASSSLCVVVAVGLISGRKVARELIDQRRHPHAVLDGRIVCEGQLRRPLQAQLPRDPRLDDPMRRLEACERRSPLVLVTEHGDEDDALTKVARDLDRRHRHEPDPRVLQLGDRLRDDGADGLVHPTHPLGRHRGEVSRRATRASRWSAPAASPAPTATARPRPRGPRRRARRARRRPPSAHTVARDRGGRPRRRR